MEQFKQNYLNQNERMNPQLENILKSNQLDLANNPVFPKTDASGNPINFLELISYKRFLDVVEKAKRYTNLQNVTGGGLGQLSSMLMQGVQFIQRIEAPHKQELENLAVDLVVEEMEIPDGAFQFQCKLVPVGSINQDGFQKEVEEPNEEKINKAFENESEEVEIPADELFEDEKHKRRFINMLIQGSSKKGHYMFELVRNKLNEYNPNLAETYGKVMSINDLIYWLLDDESIKQMASNPSSMAGKEEIEKSEEGEDGEEGQEGGAIIKTEAICFPVSLHEIIKGVMEVFGTQGLPDDPQQANLVINAVDSLSNETMDLRLGTIVWEKFYRAYPTFILEEGNRYLQHHLFARFCALPTDEFFRVSRLIMSDDPKGAKYFAKMVDEIQSSLDSYDDTNIDDINIDDIFNYKTGGQTKNKKGDIGKSGTQYGYTLKEWNKIAEKNGLLVSPTQWWKSQEGKKYKDFVGRNKIVGQHSGDKEQQMNRYGYMIANGMDLGSDKIPASAKKYVQDNNLNKFGEGGKAGEKYILRRGNPITKYVRAYYNETISNDDNGYQVNLMFYNNQDDDDYFDEEFITTNSPKEAEELADKINEVGHEGFMPKPFIIRRGNKYAEGGSIKNKITHTIFRTENKTKALNKLKELNESEDDLDLLFSYDLIVVPYSNSIMSNYNDYRIVANYKYKKGGQVDTKLTFEKTMKIANETAKFLGKEYSVTKNSVESASFDLDFNDIEYDGGSYVIMLNGDVVNYALPEKPIYYNYKSKNEYANGGEVQDWMRQALLNLQLVEDNDTLQITHINDTVFDCEGDNSEYRVYKNYEIAYDNAVEQVREDLEENPDYFSQNWLINWVDVGDEIIEIMEEEYRYRAENLSFENNSLYKNGLIEQMVEYGLISVEEAISNDAEEIAEDNVDNLVDLYVEENSKDDKGIEWYISNFGETEYMDFIIDNNLIDISGATEDAIDTDGVEHFLASYDGEVIELDNEIVAYRTN